MWFFLLSLFGIGFAAAGVWLASEPTILRPWVPCPVLGIGGLFFAMLGAATIGAGVALATAGAVW